METYKKVDNSMFSEFDTDYKDGILTLRLASWDEFHSVVKKFNNYPDYFWRGQKDNKTLWSSFDQYLECKKISLNKKGRQEELRRIMNNLKQSLKDLPNTHNIDFSKDDEVWAIRQHYGLKTPLLDWTESPYIAAYFSFYKKSEEKNSSRVIYALSRGLKLLMNGKNRFVEFDLPNNNFDSRQNHRLINQKGKFTIALEGKDIKSIVKEFWKTGNKKGKNYTTKVILAEILVPDKFQDDCLAALKAMNITHGTLFPDYAGAVEICKIDLGIDNICCDSKIKK